MIEKAITVLTDEACFSYGRLSAITSKFSDIYLPVVSRYGKSFIGASLGILFISVSVIYSQRLAEIAMSA